MAERLRSTSPHELARLAGLLYLISVVAAVLAEFVLKGKVGFFIAVVIPISCYLAVTVLLYLVFRVVSRPLALAALVFNVGGLFCEALELRTRGMNLGMVAHGVYCVLIGFLMLRSGFLPRVLGALMALGGLVWLLYLLPGLTARLSPWNTAVGLLGEGLPMLWLLAMGLTTGSGKQPAEAAATP